MRFVSISVTEASRNFADCINRARYQDTTFILHKNGVVVARIVPEPTSQREEAREEIVEPARVEAAATTEKTETAVRVETPVRDASAAPPSKPRVIW